MDNQPLVSVVTATYNMAQYVCEALDSILNQDYPNIEAIVVDDGSTDDTQSRLARYADDDRVKVIYQENKGQTVAKNCGLASAQGDFVAFCDADNRWLPGKLTSQIPLFKDNPDLGVVYGDIILIDEDGNPKTVDPTKRYSGKITAPLFRNNFVPFNTAVAPRRVLEEVGGFDEDLRMAIDYDLWLRISLHHNFLFLDRPLVEYRIWGGQMSHRTGERLDNSFLMMEKFLADNPGALTPKEVSRAWAYTLTTRGRWHTREGRRSEAMFDFQAAISQYPLDSRAWKSLARLILGM